MAKKTVTDKKRNLFGTIFNNIDAITWKTISDGYANLVKTLFHDSPFAPIFAINSDIRSYEKPYKHDSQQSTDALQLFYGVFNLAKSAIRLLAVAILWTYLISLGPLLILASPIVGAIIAAKSIYDYVKTAEFLKNPDDSVLGGFLLMVKMVEMLAVSPVLIILGAVTGLIATVTYGGYHACKFTLHGITEACSLFTRGLAQIITSPLTLILLIPHRNKLTKQLGSPTIESSKNLEPCFDDSENFLSTDRMAKYLKLRDCGYYDYSVAAVVTNKGIQPAVISKYVPVCEKEYSLCKKVEKQAAGKKPVSDQQKKDMDIKYYLHKKFKARVALNQPTHFDSQSEANAFEKAPAAEYLKLFKTATEQSAKISHGSSTLVKFGGY